MKNKIWLFAFLGAASAAPAVASTADFGPVSALLVIPASGVMLFNQPISRTAVPSCGAGLSQRWAIDVSTPGGQSMISGLLYAHANHKRVFILGTGNCSVWGDTESVQHIQIED